MKNQCISCDGTGKAPEFLRSPTRSDKCYSCDGTGIRTDGTDELVCPYCGEEEYDSTEYNDSSEEHECGSCEKKYQFEVEFSKSFSSRRADCLNDTSLHQWKENEFYKDKRRDGKAYCHCKLCHQRRWVPEAEVYSGDG